MTINGHRLHYLDEGSGPVIVMVHGNPTWSFYYRRLVSLLSKTHRVIVPDHLGCGLSDKPQDYSYTLENHIDNLSRLLSHLDVVDYSLVVHDWGGPIGLGCAVRHPERVERLLVFNTAGFRSKRIPFRIAVCKFPFIGCFIVRGLNGFCRPASFMAVKKPLDSKVRGSYLAPYNSWKNRVAIHNFVKDIPLSPSHRSYDTLAGVEDGLELLRHKKIPVMIIWGAKDFCFNDSFFNEWLRRFPEADSHYLKDCGHYVLEDGWPSIRVLAKEFFGSANANNFNRAKE